MMSTCKNIISLLAAAAVALLTLGACSSSGDGFADDGDKVNLTLRIMPVSSRSGDGKALKSDVMHNLRVVILNSAGNRVLVNQLLPLGGDAVEAATPMYQVDAGTTLQLYLLANCTDYDFGEDVNFDDDELYTSGDIDKLTFTFTPTAEDKYVPMTRKTTLTIPTRNLIPEDGRYLYPETQYVVRAVNKLTVKFCNKTGEDIDIQSYSLGRINDGGLNYLMPNVTQYGWFDILKSQATGAPITEERWITEYTLPGELTHNEFAFTDAITVKPNENPSEPEWVEGKSWLFAESKDRRLAGIPFQLYDFSVTTSKGTFTTKPGYLDNLYSLFRDTHVIIQVTFTTIGCEIDVQPYQEYEVGVDFGLLRNNLGDLMVVPDADGKYSYEFDSYLKEYKSRHGVDLLPVKDIDKKEVLELKEGDYYAIHLSSDGDLYSEKTEVWLMDSEGCRVLSNFGQKDDTSTSCSSRLIEYFPWTSTEGSIRYYKDAEHDIRLQHHADHSCLVYGKDNMLYFKEYEEETGNPKYYHVEAWEGSWDPEKLVTTPGKFYVEERQDGKTVYREYDKDGSRTETIIIYEEDTPQGEESEP